MKTFPFKILFVISLVILLGTCGPVSSSSTMLSKNTPQVSKEISFNVGPLHINSAAGIHCENHAPYDLTDDAIPGAIRANLVLAKDRLEYDSEELLQMRLYIDALYRPGFNNVPLPSTLKWIPGGTEGTLQVWGILGCYGYLQVTNNSSNAIQIKSMGMKLDAPVTVNNQSYNLVNICSFIMSDISCPPQGSGGSDASYIFQLHKADPGTLFLSQAMDQHGQPSTTKMETLIEPHQEVDVYFLFKSTPGNLIYPVTPEISIYTGTTTKIYELPILSTKLYFANSRQFACYSLQWATLVPFSEDKPGLCI